MTEHTADLLAPNDGSLDSETGEGQPIDSGGWWTPYVETPWGYFRFAVRPVEQPDGVILFWHDADGAHSQHVVTDLPRDRHVLHRLVDRLLRLVRMTAGLRREEIARPLTPEEEAEVRRRRPDGRPGMDFLIARMEPWSWLVGRLLATLDEARSQDTATARIAALTDLIDDLTLYVLATPAPDGTAQETDRQRIIARLDDAIARAVLSGETRTGGGRPRGRSLVCSIAEHAKCDGNAPNGPAGIGNPCACSCHPASPTTPAATEETPE